MFGKKKSKKPQISRPSNFEHRVHTGFDPNQGTFVGLPLQWKGVVEPDSSRPRPIVDPALVTPTDIAPLKVTPNEGILAINVIPVKNLAIR